MKVNHFNKACYSNNSISFSDSCLVSVSGSAALHDVEGGVEEGDEGEASGQAVLHELLGGGGAGPAHGQDVAREKQDC